jgi:tetratricopeptide (TPR) repeat protein
LTEAQQLLHNAIPVQEQYLRRATLQDTRDTYAKQLAISLELLACVHDRQGQFASAEPLYKRSISLGQHTLESDDEARIMRNYAEMLIKMGRADDAARLKEEATALQLGLKQEH